VLYRLACGKAPFEADTLGRLLTMVMHEQASPPRAVRPDLPPGFDAVVMRCLEKDPEARFANVAELAYALSAYAREPARATATAARVASTLSVAGPSPSTLEIPRAHLSSPPSGPPAVVDTGTASPWTDTRGADPSRARSTLIGVGVALAALLVIGAAASKLHARVNASNGTSGETAVAAAPPAPPEAAETSPAEPSPFAPPPVVLASPPALPAPRTAPEPAATTGSTPPTASVSSVKRSAAPAVRRPRPPPSSPATAAPAKTDEGIPSTRD
jgi:eukaryotic-like serine/threonine-protein kinase